MISASDLVEILRSIERVYELKDVDRSGMMFDDV